LNNSYALLYLGLMLSVFYEYALLSTGYCRSCSMFLNPCDRRKDNTSRTTQISIYFRQHSTGFPAA